jgi:small multidrug resistance pump
MGDCGEPGMPMVATVLKPWLLLFVAIVAEVIATSMLKSTEGFTRLWPSVVVVVCYETAFILMSLTLKKIPVGIVYAVWSGVGVALITLVAWLFLGQTLDAAGLLGVALIVGGVVVINVYSRSTVH